MRAAKLLLVNKHAAPDVFYLPGGKPERGETTEESLRREIAEELCACVVGSRPPTVVHAPAAIEGGAMEMQVHLGTRGDPHTTVVTP